MIEFKHFLPEEHGTWKELFNRQLPLRTVQLHPIFDAGVKALGFTADHIPDLKDVNKKLKTLTGFEGVPVTGLEEPLHFFELLAKRKFPIGNFIRDKKDLSYTPAPDVFHDLYGHIPFFANKQYADFCYEFGQSAVSVKDTTDGVLQFNRLFWFTIEFALVKTPQGKRIFGAGIASSFTECAYALSDKPTVRPFDIDVMRHRDYRIDALQDTLFLLESAEQLYGSLDAMKRQVRLGL